MLNAPYTIKDRVVPISIYLVIALISNLLITITNHCTLKSDYSCLVVLNKNCHSYNRICCQWYML